MHITIFNRKDLARQETEPVAFVVAFCSTIVEGPVWFAHEEKPRRDYAMVDSVPVPRTAFYMGVIDATLTR